MLSLCGSVDKILCKKASQPFCLVGINSCKSAFYSTLTFFSIMTSRRSKIQEDTYFRVLRILQERPDVTQREIAQLLGVSTGGLNYCLKALIDKGWVKVYNFSESRNKFGYVYLLTPSGIAEKAALAGRFLQRKLLEYESMRVEIESLRDDVVTGFQVPVDSKIS
jgi:EPS-associated MarR family transcriptional regulator